MAVDGIVTNSTHVSKITCSVQNTAISENNKITVILMWELCSFHDEHYSNLPRKALLLFLYIIIIKALFQLCWVGYMNSVFSIPIYIVLIHDKKTNPILNTRIFKYILIFVTWGKLFVFSTYILVDNSIIFQLRI